MLPIYKKNVRTYMYSYMHDYENMHASQINAMVMNAARTGINLRLAWYPGTYTYRLACA